MESSTISCVMPAIKQEKLEEMPPLEPEITHILKKIKKEEIAVPSIEAFIPPPPPEVTPSLLAPPAFPITSGFPVSRRIPSSVPNTKYEDPHWDECFQKLAEFQAREGHSQPDLLKYPDQCELGNWVRIQRLLKKRGKLSVAQITSLEGLGFQWCIPWIDRFQEIKAFKEKTGGFKVPAAFPELKGWVQNQKNANLQNRLKPDRKRLLESIGFEWVKHEFDRHLEELRAFKEKNGHTNVDPTTDLGDWLQRQLKKKRGLTRNQTEKLEDLGFNCRKDTSWASNLEDLNRFRQMFGHLNIPHTRRRMHCFLLKQKRAKKNEKLTKNEIKDLEAVGVTWN